MQNLTGIKKASFGPKIEFPLSSEQCEILCALETCKSVGALAEHLKRDPSAVSRQLTKIAEAAPVLEKIQGRWALTPLGREVAIWSRDASTALKRLFEKRQTIRIGTTREFAARVLCPQLPGFLQRLSESSELVLLTSESGAEELLLNGEIDFGFDCGRPRDPMIKHKMVKSEPFGIYVSPAFLRANPAANLHELLLRPNLQYRRVSTSRYLKLSSEVPAIAGYFNDLAAMREACCAGLGWAVLPTYSVRKEVEEGALKELSFQSIAPEKYGVWWLRSNTSLQPIIDRAAAWLESQSL